MSERERERERERQVERDTGRYQYIQREERAREYNYIVNTYKQA